MIKNLLQGLVERGINHTDAVDIIKAISAHAFEAGESNIGWSDDGYWHDETFDQWFESELKNNRVLD